MEGPSRSSGCRQSRRSRSQRDRERQRRRVDLAEQRATSLSSGSEREAGGTTNSVLGAVGRECRPGFGRHRPPRRRKRESVSCEEDIIDGFAIASFISFEALEMDCSLKPNQRAAMLMGRGNKRKRKRGPEENGGGLLSEPEEGGPPSFSHSCWSTNRKKRRKTDVKGASALSLETGYICDTESDSGDKASDGYMEPVFTVSTRKVMEATPVSMASSVSKNGPSLPSRCGGITRLMVTPGVSGLERSHERNLEPPYPDRHQPSPPLSKHKPFLTFQSQPHPISLYSIGNNRNNASIKASAPSAASSSSNMRPPTPSTSMSMSLMRVPGASGPMRPPSRAASGALYTSPPGLPPPPPLLQVSAHPNATDQELLRQSLNSHFMASQERDGRRSAPGSEGGGGGAATGRSTPGGPPTASSTPGSSGRTSQNQPNIPPLFDKYPGKMDGLYRHTFFPQYPPPSVPGIQPVIPPNGPFSSLQGAFQPKGTGPEMTARLGVVPHHLQPKDPRLTDPFGTSLKVSNKPGKWCAMHVHVAWMILSHQKKVKLMQADPHKLDFRNELLARLPGAGGMGPLGPMGGGLPPSHDLTRPASGVHQSSSPFIPPSTPHSSFLNPAAHLDPYGRSPPFTPLGALGSGAFGGLGSPTLGGPVFGHKDSPAGVVGSMSNPNHHDPWNRLQGGQPGFPGGPGWAKGADKRDERDRGKEPERRDIPHIKDEKDRDNMLYGRQPVRMSPVAPTFKPRSSTPVSQLNGHGSGQGGNGGPIEELARSINRDRDGDKRPSMPMMSSRGPPLGPSSLVSDQDRPRSSSSSVLTTPPPSNRSAPSPMDLYPRAPQHPIGHGHHGEHPHGSSQRDSHPSSSSMSAAGPAMTLGKKPDRTTTPVSKHPFMTHGKKPDRTTTPVSKHPMLLPPVKVKEERKEEPEHIPITLHPPPHGHGHNHGHGHGFERPNSRPHQPNSSTPSSSLSLTPTPGVPIPPATPHPPPHHHHHLSLFEHSRALEAYLGSTAGAGGLVMGPGGERFAHGPPQGPSQNPHTFTWDPWRELAAQQQQQQRREAMAMRSDPHLAMRSDPHLALRSDPHLALRSDPHLARLLQHQHAQRFLEAERAASNPHHPQTSTSSAAAAAAVRQEFSLMAHHFDRPPQLGPPGGGLMDEEQRAQILREDFERARYFGMHPHPHAHPHLSASSHLQSQSHAAATAAHLEQLHPGLLAHSLSHGASAGPQHHPGLYSRLGPMHPHHMSNGILTKTPAGLVGALSVGAPPPLIPSVTSRSATPPRGSRLGGPGEMTLYSAHKDGESR
ncbi:hypothetical protein NHX12_025041 [Muraenolepis orangiensis]|uniref:Autism susceptibility gene 2 protein-like n=1 Tax=Muraenolepis orangiensis TaxID=630683 RepID=A0A9Q0IRW4_9TELE|nr:hypothetical protein NHX12_025041 [Muraenolepis orangiensis]